MSSYTEASVLERTDEQSGNSLLISFRDISISYDGSDKQIVQNINFSLYEGESVLFLGPSGCGKSTLAMLCGGLIPGSIEARVTGDIWRSPDVSEPGEIGYVFQDPDAEFCMLTVADEVAFGLENVSLQQKDMDERIADSLTAAGLFVPFQANHASFSGGMKQKLAIASALALNPRLLIFDEPTANLDPKSTSQVFHQISVLRKLGRTMIVIEHKFEKLIPMMDRVVLFDHDGCIHRIGPANEVITEEWAWMIQEGIVDSWKLPPCERDRMQPANRRVTRIVPESHEVACCLSHVSVNLAKNSILRDVSLDIHQGEFVAVLGPNGAGKSTLLQTMAGLVKPKRGEAVLFGKRASKLSRRERQNCLAYCFQNPEFQFIYETVGDELANRRTGNQVPDKVIMQLQQFGLEGTERQSPFSLSQGQKRRLSVASMLRDTHDIFFLDEPTFGQDASTKKAIMEQLLTLNEAGKSIVMTTHDLDLVSQYATKVVVVVEGKIQFCGSFAELQRDFALQKEAHLVETVEPGPVEKAVQIHNSEADTGHRRRAFVSRLAPPAKSLHPVVLLLSLLIATGVTLQAGTLSQSFACFAFSIIVMMTLGFITPFKIAKLLLPFMVFYVIYVWSFAANAAIPAGEQTIHILSMNLSVYGLMQGVILALRMLSSVLFGIFYIMNTDMSDLMVGLSKDFRVPPKFAYGMLAGLRVVPLFTAEWIKLRQARQLRGKDARVFFLRPAVYFLPLLSQAIRMSERVAIAMEARGFIGRPAISGKARTYYRIVKMRGWDPIAGMFLIVCAFLCIWMF